MRDANKFKKLVFYMEACESGSMFEGWEIDGVFAVSAASPTESSWAQYCGPDAIVSGVDIGSCLGDEFSVAWMEDSDATDTTTETLNDQFQIVKARTPDSHVNMWGDTTFASDMLSTYIGNLPEVSVTADVVTADVASRSSASAREVDLARLFRKYMMAPSPADRIKVGQVLQKELQGQLEVEAAYTRFVALAYPDDVAKQQAMWSGKTRPGRLDCERSTRDAFKTSPNFNSFSTFAMQFHQVIVNVCADVAETGANLDLVQLAHEALSGTAPII